MNECRENYSLGTLQTMCQALYGVRRYSDNKDISPQNVLSIALGKQPVPEFQPNFPELADLPELTVRKNNRSHLWNNLEERETVIDANMSELILRLSASLPIRYIYQLRGRHFFEDFDTVFQIVKNAKGDFEKDSLIAFINNDVHVQHFDTRKFRYLIDEELLSAGLCKFLGAERSSSAAQVFAISGNKPRRRMPKVLLTRMVNQIISDFNSNNLEKVVRQLWSPRIEAVKFEIRDILDKRAESVVSEVEQHIRNSADSYNKEIIRKLIDLLSSAVENQNVIKDKNEKKTT